MIGGCQIDKNPCSLSGEILQDLRRLDSLTNIPEVLERDRQSMKINYDEPSILDAKNETYRFILSSMDYSKVVRIEKKNNQFYAIVKEFEGTTGDPNLIPKVDEFELSKTEWDTITSRLQKMNFWTYTSTIDRRGLDGASWSLTAYKPVKDECTLKNFHSISRWSPIDTTFINMCKLIYEVNE